MSGSKQEAEAARAAQAKQEAEAAAKAAAAQAQAKAAALAAARPALPGWTAEYADKERKVFYSRPRNATHPEAAALTYAEMEGVVQKEKEEAATAELEALRRAVAAAEAKAHADVQAAAATNAAKDAAHAAELAALHQASPSTAVAALYKARAARVQPAAATTTTAAAAAATTESTNALAFEPRAQVNDPDMAEAVAALRERCPPNDKGSSSSPTTAAAAPDFQVPHPLEAALAAADAAQACLDALNAAIAETCTSAVETDVDVDVDAARAAVQERDRARAQYVEAAGVLQSEHAAAGCVAAASTSFRVANHFGALRAALPREQQAAVAAAAAAQTLPPAAAIEVAESAVAAVDAWCNRAALQQSAATEKTEAAAAAVSAALSTLAEDAARVSATPTPADLPNTAAAPTMTLADGELEAACARLTEAVHEEADTRASSTDPGTFPTEAVVAAVHCLEAAATEVWHRFETIYKAVTHHQATSAAAAEWVDPAAKDALVAAVDN
eukprot:gene7154-21514_t